MIIFFLQLLIPQILIFLRFKRKKYFLVRFLITLGSILLVGTFIPNEGSLSFLGEHFRYYSFYLLTYLFIFLLIYISFDLPFITILYYTIAGFLIQNTAHHLSGFILRLANIPLINQYDKPEYIATLIAISAVVYGVFVYFFYFKLKAETLLKLPTGSTLFVSGAFLLIMIGLGVFIRHIKNDIFSNFTVAIIYEAYSVIVDFLIISIQFGVFTATRLRESNKELEQKLEIESHYYKLAQENMEAINIKCHDLKHQIGALKSIDDPNIRKESILDLEKDVLIYEDIAKTQNEALDYIFTEKSLIARKNNITFTYIADGRKMLFMNFNDTCSLFGNALDNAIEASSKVKEKEKRVITLKIIEKASFVHVHIANYHENKLNFNDGLPLTTKKEAGHGFGTKSIKYIVEKYNGNLTLRDENSQFIIDILFPINQNK